MRQRPCVVSVRLTDEEAAAIETAASRHALSAGQYLRARGLVDGAPVLPLPITRRRPPADAGLLAEIAGHLGRIGGNSQPDRARGQSGLRTYANRTRGDPTGLARFARCFGGGAAYSESLTMIVSP